MTNNLPPVTIAGNHTAAGVPKLTALVVGPWGSGKTTWAARSANPLFLLTEPQGRAAIIATNPAAQIIEIDTWETFGLVMGLLQNMMQLEAPDGQAWFAFQYGATVVKFQTLCIDGLTDLQAKLVANLCKADPDGGLSLPAYNHLLRRFVRVLETIRSLPCSSVSTLLAHRITAEDGSLAWDVAFFGRAIKPIYGQYFSAVGLMTSVEREVNGKREAWMGIQWQGPSTLPCRPFFGFPRVSQNTMEPGAVTLGSLMLSAFPGVDSIPRAPGDSADHIQDPLPSYGSPTAAPSLPPSTGTAAPSAPDSGDGQPAGVRVGGVPPPAQAPAPAPIEAAPPEPEAPVAPQRTIKTASSVIRF